MFRLQLAFVIATRQNKAIVYVPLYTKQVIEATQA